MNGYRNLFEQALLNLCINARDAMPQGGTLTLEATAVTLDPGEAVLPPSQPPGRYVRIEARDTGVGMKPEVIEHIFEPLFTTKGPAQGSGLGLAIVEKIVKDAGGFVSVTSKSQEGTQFAVFLPAVFPRRPPPIERPSTRLEAGWGTILVVDDEPRVLEFLEKGLTRLGYEVLPAESGRIACDLFAKQSREIACVLLDMVMPEMSGLETYARLREIDPQVKVILSSGYSSGRTRREAAEAGGAEFLGKPHSLETLSQTLRRLQRN